MQSYTDDYIRFLGTNRRFTGDMLICKRRAGEVSQIIRDLQNGQAALDDVIQDLTLVRRWFSERLQDLKAKDREIGEALLEYDTCPVYTDCVMNRIGQKITSVREDVRAVERCQVEIDMLRGTVQHGYFEDICKEVKAEEPKDEVIGKLGEQLGRELQI